MTTTTRDVGAPTTDVLTCGRCGSDWHRPRVRGRRPTLCPSCAGVPQRRTATGGTSSRRLDTNTAGYRLAAVVTAYRIAIETASAAIALGRYHEAQQALRAVAAPGMAQTSRPRADQSARVRGAA